MSVKEMRETRAKHVADARAVLNEAEKAKREPNAEERSKFDGYMAEADKLEEQIARHEKLESAEKSLAESRGRQTENEEPGRQPNSGEVRTIDRRATVEYRSMFAAYLCGGFQSFGPVEHRALSAASDVSGGYLAAPQQMVSELIKFVDNAVILRQLATKFSLAQAQSMGAASLDADPDDADWTAEIATGSEDSAMAFGKRELNPHPLAKRIKASNRLLQLTNAESLIRERLGYKFAVAQEKAFMTGNGQKKALGVFTASDEGIPTTRDVATGNSSTAITGDGLVNCKYSLKEPYLRSGKLRWIFHRDAVKMIRKLKDGNNNYVWMPGLGGTPDTLLDVPVLMSEYAPNTFTTGLYVGLLGDFSQYWIADAMTLAIQRLVELYAETNQIGFIGRLECDGMPVLSEAFARVTLA